ncbi:MAG: hypothetical protein AABX01_07275 [Candidatus Micrarchaeota archaeon]
MSNFEASLHAMFEGSGVPTFRGSHARGFGVRISHIRNDLGGQDLCMRLVLKAKVPRAKK